MDRSSWTAQDYVKGTNGSLVAGDPYQCTRNERDVILSGSK